MFVLIDNTTATLLEDLDKISISGSAATEATVHIFKDCSME